MIFFVSSFSNNYFKFVWFSSLQVVLAKKFDANQISRPLLKESRGLQDPVARGWGDADGWSGGFGPSGSFGSPDLERIERRAFAMGLAKGASFGPPPPKQGQFYDDFPNGPARMGFGYGGPPRFESGFGRPGMGPPAGGMGNRWGGGGGMKRGRGGRF